MTLTEFLEKDFFELVGMHRAFPAARVAMENAIIETAKMKTYCRLIELIPTEDDRIAFVEATDTSPGLAQQILARFSINPDMVAMEESILHKIGLYEGMTGDVVTA